MSSTPPRQFTVDGIALDAETLGRKAVGMARTMIGVLATIAVVIGIALLVWPGKTLVVAGALTGVFFLLTGIVRVAVGVFSREVATGFRVLNIILGLFLVFGGIVVLKNLTAATGVLTVFVVILIGVGWIIDGVATLAETGRSSGSAWGYVRGTISILAGIAVIVVPTWTAFALVMLVGISLVLIGIAGIIQAFALGKDLAKAPQTIDG
ncbi:HdeD family acid-resistance protein [uncultured Demequina sp.]|uniref:HdeD family acid-resistance protein n=1 Tax=uncultured Demequina sp. TaxID=693499 RepID=UPI0025DC0D57|nr:DUF308 domain-containing protein [uncultured Demequina sp.]